MTTEEKIRPYMRPGTGEIGPALLLREGSGSLPFVSVILPTRCEERYIESCLLSILSQNYPLYRMEILVVDGMSSDKTREIVRHIAKKYPQVRLLDNPDRFAAQGLNLGIQNSRGAYILRLDPRGEYTRGYVKACIDTLLMTGADNVGGPQLPKARTFFQRVVSCALQSPLSPDGAPRRKNGKDGYVDSVFPGAFRRQALQRVGLFDPGARSNEDAEINQRIVTTGGKIYFSSAIECFFYPRESIASLMVEFFRHGRGRARTVLKHGQVPPFNATLPFALISSIAMLLAAGCFAAPMLWAAAALAGFCAFGAAIESVRLAIAGRAPCALFVPLVFGATYLSHAAGFAWGLLYYCHNPDWTHTPPPLLQH